MTYDRNPSPRRGIFTGTIVAALVAAILVCGGLVWLAANPSSSTVVNAPAFERSVPDAASGTSGQGRTTPSPPR